MPDDLRDSVRIVPLQWSQLAAATALQTRAFARDPVSTYFFPGTDCPKLGMQPLHELGTRYALLYGQCDTTPGMEGLALWLPPGRGKLTLWQVIRSGGLRLFRKTGLRLARKALRFNAECDRLHDRAVRQQHWYLMILAVDPDHQGRGFGSQLLRTGLARADAQGTPCYLETLTQANVSYYAGFGFRLVEEIRLQPGNVPVYGLLRDPPAGRSPNPSC